MTGDVKWRSLEAYRQRGETLVDTAEEFLDADDDELEQIKRDILANSEPPEFRE